MEESILATIKKLLGLGMEYTPFDTDVIVLINSALMTLTQADVGPKSGFRITGLGETWGDFLTNPVMVEGAKEYIYLRVKMVFDPSSSGTVAESMKQVAQETLWRLIAQAESAEFFDFIPATDEEKAAQEAAKAAAAGHSDSGGAVTIVYSDGITAGGDG